MKHQPYLQPPALFDIPALSGTPGGAALPLPPSRELLEFPSLAGLPMWTCVRTRPRWEKKFATWAAGRRIPHFLPVYPRETFSHRKRRVLDHPLFPGYVFVPGDHHKSEFAPSGSVVYVLKPRSDREAVRLSSQLRNIWNGLLQGAQPVPTKELAPGEAVEVTSGPLMGTQGTLLRTGGGMSLILWVDMLGTGVEVRIGPETGVRRVDPC